MANEHFRHIFLSGPSIATGFTNPRTTQHDRTFPPRNRNVHSRFLRERFEEAWEAAEQQRAVSIVEQHGTYIEFQSEPGFDLKLQSLEQLNSGIRLLNVQRRNIDTKDQTIATVYVPNNKRTHFLEKIRQYAEEVTKKGSFKNAPLIESVSDIRLSVLESFWQDKMSSLPGENKVPIEVWLSKDDEEIIERFNQILEKLQIASSNGVLRFPERAVKFIYSNRDNLQALIENSDDIAEFRAIPPISTYYVLLENKQQVELAKNLLQRTEFKDDSNLVVCILDSGVNNGHLLIQPVLKESDMYTVDETWGINDHEGHGTLMAGTVTYGDLLSLIMNDESLVVSHRIESSKIVPPDKENPKELWGFITAQGMSRAEIEAPERDRIFCMAITSIDDRDRGRPSSWSAMMDSLASGYNDEKQRLIVVSAGNVVGSEEWLNYPSANLTNEVHDPGQAWNVITVGAYTTKVNIHDVSLNNYHPIAPAGGLSPFSTTSTTWVPRRWPIKPEVLFEGGNVAKGPNDSTFHSEDLQLLSTHYDPQTAQFEAFSATSAASAQAAWMAAKIQSQYPNVWPETIRALLIHSSKWTDTMRSQFLPNTPTKNDYSKLLRICGYGVPNIDNALYCASNSLTMISQAKIQPFEKSTNRYVSKEMHLYRLPWPTEVLQGLGATEVQMRITLSYFVEPGPGEIGWEGRYRYASHGLRFEVNGSGETEKDFLGRINKQARDDGESPGTEGPGQKWLIGTARNVGSIHSDIWVGRSIDLAASNMIAIYPTIGWWRERHYLKRWDKKCRYSLIISIDTPSEDIDIYTPVIQQIGIPIEIQISRNG